MITASQLLAAHAAYLQGEGERPCGRNADLSGASFRDANLRGADLYNANLAGASLYNANLAGASLYNANLTGCKGAPANASVQWRDMGERGRRMSAYRHLNEDDTTVDLYTCGCVRGVTLDEMRAWIEADRADLRASRLRALDIVAGFMAEQR
jgi:uncharacterized protein YjbI with pentapeptide repeats